MGQRETEAICNLTWPSCSVVRHACYSADKQTCRSIFSPFTSIFITKRHNIYYLHQRRWIILSIIIILNEILKYCEERYGGKRTLKMGMACGQPIFRVCGFFQETPACWEKKLGASDKPAGTVHFKDGCLVPLIASLTVSDTNYRFD